MKQETLNGKKKLKYLILEIARLGGKLYINFFGFEDGFRDDKKIYIRNSFLNWEIKNVEK